MRRHGLGGVSVLNHVEGGVGACRKHSLIGRKLAHDYGHLPRVVRSTSRAIEATDPIIPSVGRTMSFRNDLLRSTTICSPLCTSIVAPSARRPPTNLSCPEEEGDLRFRLSGGMGVAHSARDCDWAGC